MTEIAFYHLESSSLEQALPILLEKTLQAGKRALVLSGSDARVEWLNGQLWTHDADGWLPHGSVKDGSPEEQPVWISTEDVNPNGSQFLFLTDGVSSSHIEQFERCFELFDGHDQSMVKAARARWKIYLDEGHQLTYWKQSEQGRWEKKA